MDTEGMAGALCIAEGMRWPLRERWGPQVMLRGCEGH